MIACLLSTRWWVNLVGCLQQGSDRGTQVGSSRDVHGALPEIDPERRCQVACGLAQSARDHWFLTMVGKSPMDVPVGSSIEVKEGPYHELPFDDG